MSTRGHQERAAPWKKSPCDACTLSNINTVGSMLYACILILFLNKFHSFVKITYEMRGNVCRDTHVDSFKRASRDETKICQQVRSEEYLRVFQPKAEVDSERLVFTEDSVCG